MSNIEIGEYVRTVEGYIDIFKEVNDETNIARCKKNKYWLNSIIKHSKNIIDLIEIGDYVNGDEAIDKYLFAGEKPVLETNGNSTNCKCLCNEDIKIIVTKEQMENISYKVGG